MKKTFTLILISLSQFYFSQTIAEARNQSIGQTVTINGVATNGGELGAIRYIQDATAALPAYGNNLSGVQRGDSVSVTGVMFEFSGLLELSPTTSFTILGQGTIPEPLSIPITSANESLEAQLVQFENVSFVQSGFFSTGSSTVQITDGTNTLDVRINGSTNIDGSEIPSGPVTVVGLVGQFNANYQLIPRDLEDIFPYVAPAKEINVKMNGTDLLNNGTYVVGNSNATTITIENTGSESLTLTGVSLSGANAIDFSTDLAPTTIAPLSSEDFTLNFSPSTIGSMYAALVIDNDDSDENPYTINLQAFGTDNLATEPSVNASSLVFNTIEAYTLNGSYQDAASDGYLVLWKIGSSISEEPQDGASYLRGDYIGDAKVAYVGSGSSITPRGVIANQDYYFKVFAFNGSDGFENYRTTDPAEGQVTSSGAQIGDYYNGISSASSTLLADLNTLINPHNYISYFLYKTTLMSQFEVKDTTNGQSYVTCCYSGENKVFNDPFDWSDNNYSREHTYAHSWMGTFPCNDPEQEEYADQHNLYPANLPNANSPRSNLPLEDISGDVVFNYLGGSVGYNENGQLVYEPRASHKGNAARAIFYMATCYTGNGGNNWAVPTNQSAESLVNWHFNDLPDDYEIARHEYIFNLQNNRNPYIDSVDYACYINFGNMTYKTDGCGNAGVETLLNQNFSVFPIPSSNKLFAQINGEKITAYQLISMEGKQIDAKSNLNLSVLELNTSSYNSGAYLLNVTSPKGVVQKKVIIE
jgi:hypothetical protein